MRARLSLLNSREKTRGIAQIYAYAASPSLRGILVGCLGTRGLGFKQKAS